MGATKNVAPCGIICEGCTYQEGCDGGCHEGGGKPFYIKEFGVEVCPVYSCAVTQKGYTTCGECEDLPCKLFFDWRDPSMSEEAHLQSINTRAEALKKGSGVSFS